MRLQVSSDLDSEMLVQSFIRAIAQELRSGAPRPGLEEGEQDPGRASACRQCTHAAVDSTGILRGAGGLAHKWQKRNANLPELRGQRKNYTGIHFSQTQAIGFADGKVIYCNF